MNVQDDYLFVRFDKYCKTCKHEKLEENEPPLRRVSGASSKPALA